MPPQAARRWRIRTSSTAPPALAKTRGPSPTSSILMQPHASAGRRGILTPPQARLLDRLVLDALATKPA